MTHLTSLSTWGVILCLAGAGYCAWVLFTMWLDHVALERESRDPADHSPHPFESFTSADLDEYAEAADAHTARQVAQALAVAGDLIAADGCYSADHLIGVHSEGWPFNRPSLPEQRRRA
jgi:hypothetical protein